MSQKNDLTKGSILSALFKMSLPIMGTSLIQMAYNMTDMIWIGRVGSSSVAAVGTAGFLVWFGFSLIIISKIGAEVGVAQSLGKGDRKQARDFARNALQLNVISAIIYGFVIYFFRHPIINFFQLGDQNVIDMALKYLSIIALGTPFMFINPVFSGIYNGAGDSKTPFIVNTIGLGLNMVLDPLLIFGLGPIPAMGVGGAAIATIFSQLVVATLFFVLIKGVKSPFKEFHLFRRIKFEYTKKVVKFGFPVAIQSAMFTGFAMVIARLIASWGPVPIAVQKVGSQIESISWMTASGISTALSAFVGQNFGAKKWDRIWKGYFAGLGMATLTGIFATILLVVFSKQVFQIFINEEEAIRIGVVYLKILGLSQLFMCIEITTSGAFNGLGKTVPPSVVSIIFTGLRVPFAYFLASPELFGLNGIWWSISMSSVFKGIVLVTWFLIILYKHPDICGRMKIKQLIYRHDSKYLRDKRSMTGKC